MFGNLANKLRDAFSFIAGKKVLTEENLAEAVRQVRMALLEADVNYDVAMRFVADVKQKAIGQALIGSLKAGEQFPKIVHDELVALMGGGEADLDLKRKPAFIMLCGLQGSGKTTTAAKLAAYIGRQHRGKKVLLVAADLQRPAAVLQLQKLGSDIGAPVFALDNEKDPLRVVKMAQGKAVIEGFDIVIVDTAGRLHIDDALMRELQEMKKIVQPQEVFFVANATTGQDAVRVAAEFHSKVGITGSILTMLDGNARAGAALSIRAVTNVPLRFEGVGEKAQDFQLFNPRSMADRILGMGDIVNLAKKVEEHVDAEESRKMAEKLRQATFTYKDYLKQMGMVKKMGSMQGLLKMVPGFSALGDLQGSDEEFRRLEALILSMTPRERDETDELSISRRKRIAKGSGVPVDDVNRMMKGFQRVKKMFKDMPALMGKMKHTMKDNNKWH
ncbi:MAG: hypothetical protein RL235_113 [Chlamydiota bacterium]